MATLNWVYHARLDDEAEQQVSEILLEMRKLYNKYIEIELGARAEFYRQMREHFPGYAEAEEAFFAADTALEDLRAELRRRRAKSRRRLKEKELVVEIKAAEKERNRLGRELTQEKKKYKDKQSFKVIAATVDELRRRQRKEVYDASPLHWGQKNFVARCHANIASGPPPRFRRWNGEGSVAVQIQQGVGTHEPTSCEQNDWLVIDIPPTVQQLVDSGQNLGGRKTLCTAYLAVDCAGRRDKVYLKVPFFLSRPLPQGRIKEVYVDRRREDTRTTYYLRFVIDVGDPDTPHNEQVVSLHPGFRQLDDDRVRAATWIGSDGRYGSVVLDWRKYHLSTSELQSQRDTQFEELREWLDDWIAEHDTPEWMPSIGRWKSQTRLRSLIERWRDDRFDGDEEAFDRAERWRRWDRGKYQEQEGRRRRSLARRKQQLCELARDLRRDYGVLVVPDIDWAELRKRDRPEDDVTLTEDMRVNAAFCAPGEISRMFSQSFGPKRTFWVNAENITRRCHQCGHVHDEQIVRIRHQCVSCGGTWDQDMNAAINELASGEALVSSGGLLELEAEYRDKRRKAMENRQKKQDASIAARRAKAKLRQSG